MKSKFLFNTVLVGSMLFITFVSAGCADNNVTEQTAEKAFNAWAKGEASGDYGEFRALIDTGFTQFSHPLAGSFTGNEAIKKMNALIAEREKIPNKLTFSNVSVLSNQAEVGFSFRSEGIVNGRLPYKGFNLIVLTVRDGKLKGFSEYFGLIDPAWFKQ